MWILDADVPSDTIARVAQRWGITSDAATAAIRVVKAARRRGLPLHVTSGHRSYDAQYELWQSLPPGEAESPATSAHSRRFPATAVDLSSDSPESLRRLAASGVLADAGFARYSIHRGTGWHVHGEV
jgi:LAS superfamily LD-carboxypeptidase LdcB